MNFDAKNKTLLLCRCCYYTEANFISIVRQSYCYEDSLSFTRGTDQPRPHVMWICVLMLLCQPRKCQITFAGNVSWISERGRRLLRGPGHFREQRSPTFRRPRRALRASDRRPPSSASPSFPARFAFVRQFFGCPGWRPRRLTWTDWAAWSSQQGWLARIRSALPGSWH